MLGTRWVPAPSSPVGQLWRNPNRIPRCKDKGAGSGLHRFIKSNRRSHRQSVLAGCASRLRAFMPLRLLQVGRMRPTTTLPGQQQSCPVRLQVHGADTFGALQSGRRRPDLTTDWLRPRRGGGSPLCGSPPPLLRLSQSDSGVTSGAGVGFTSRQGREARSTSVVHGQRRRLATGTYSVPASNRLCPLSTFLPIHATPALSPIGP